ncbi:hypothetical protein GCM10010517_10540 [Streptosporangium fragile]|uniref:Integrase n=1 Tax=Streptosporangium fragile TaxID=46186 RepID=A0ABP6I9N7_9ACTN
MSGPDGFSRHRAGPVPYGLRHGRRTWMNDGGIKQAPRAGRMGHEGPSASAVYGHITERVRSGLSGLPTGLWEEGLA